eukprot:765123-Hanusia_phi.AAC.2
MEFESEYFAWLISKRFSFFLDHEINLRTQQISESELKFAKTHHVATLNIQTIIPSFESLNFAVETLQRAFRSFLGRKAMKGLQTYWSRIEGTVLFEGPTEPFQKNFIVSHGPEIWGYYRDHSISMQAPGPSGEYETRVIRRYSASRQVQLHSPFSFIPSKGTKYQMHHPDDYRTIEAMRRDLFLAEDLSHSGLIGKQELQRILSMVGIECDLEDCEELIESYGKLNAEKVTLEEYLQIMRHKGGVEHKPKPLLQRASSETSSISHRLSVVSSSIHRSSVSGRQFGSAEYAEELRVDAMWAFFGQYADFSGAAVRSWPDNAMPEILNNVRGKVVVIDLDEESFLQQAENATRSGAQAIIFSQHSILPERNFSLKIFANSQAKTHEFPIPVCHLDQAHCLP